MNKSAYPLALISLFSLGIVLLVLFYTSRDLNNWPNDVSPPLTQSSHLRPTQFCLFQYAVVIDAGSSGTRAFLYEWKADFSATVRDDLVSEPPLSLNLSA
jgi:hypothetical protein